MKKIVSLKKNYGVTLILLSGGLLGSVSIFVALAVKKITIVQMKNVPPIKMHTALLASN